MHLMGVRLADVYLTGMHLTRVHLTGVYLTGVYLTGVHLMACSTSQACTVAKPQWRKGCWKRVVPRQSEAPDLGASP